MSILGKIYRSLFGDATARNGVGPAQYEASTQRASNNKAAVSPDLASWEEFYPTLIGAGTIGTLAASPSMQKAAASLIERLESDNYVEFLKRFYAEGAAQAGADWKYADITTALLAAATLARPANYLEIGVRRGRSMAAVASVRPEIDIVGFDLWMEDYGGMPNPGPDFVRDEMRRLGHQGKLELISGDSHATVPEYFRRHPQAFFDLITVDGDHTDQGARLDLRDVLPRLAIGGVIVFDDIASRGAPFLRDAWNQYVGTDSRFSCWEFDELGFGIALAVRKH